MALAASRRRGGTVKTMPTNQDRGYSTDVGSIDDNTEVVAPPDHTSIRVALSDLISAPWASWRSATPPTKVTTDQEAAPILVRPVWMIVDGESRVQAARERGDASIVADVTHLAATYALTQAMKRNSQPGARPRPGQVVDAAVAMLTAEPSLSDRAIAARLGLSASTVHRARRKAAAGTPRPRLDWSPTASSGPRVTQLDSANRRRGRDGKDRPVDSNAHRARWIAVLTVNPRINIREAAEYLGGRSTGYKIRNGLARDDRPPTPAQVQAAVDALHHGNHDPNSDVIKELLNLDDLERGPRRFTIYLLSRLVIASAALARELVNRCWVGAGATLPTLLRRGRRLRRKLGGID